MLRLDCVFCRIAGGDPDNQIEAAYGKSFLITPLNPVTPGHKLMIPKRHVRDLSERPAVTGEVMRHAAEYCKHSGIYDYNIITSMGEYATQTVFHLHVHIVPRRLNDGLHLPWTELVDTK